jgi:SP family facilitated glucose transporter-like MFS transporter 1
MFYYSSELFEDIGLSSVDANYASLGVGGIMVVMTLVSIPLMDRAGRRVLHLGGLGGMLVMSVLFTILYRFAVNVSAQYDLVPLAFIEGI